MTFEEFKQMVTGRSDFTDREETIIKNIDFNDLKQWIQQVDSPGFKLVRILAYHQDCSLNVFKHIFEKHKKLFNISGDVFKKAPIFKNLEAVAFVLDCQTTNTDDLDKASVATSRSMTTSDNLIKNKNINETFKVIYGIRLYRTLNDDRYLTDEMKEFFTFSN